MTKLKYDMVTPRSGCGESHVIRSRRTGWKHNKPANLTPIALKKKVDSILFFVFTFEIAPSNENLSARVAVERPLKIGALTS
jgi:hypothetical protein